DKHRPHYAVILADWSKLAGRTPASAEPDIEVLSQKLIAWFENTDVFSAKHFNTSASTETGMPVSLDVVIPDAAQREVVLRVQRALASSSGGPS
ncbi:MAG: MerR family transcriptional regulator, partial [Rhodococcus sp. (in: high G+C Gram-positive bacteria)]